MKLLSLILVSAICLAFSGCASDGSSGLTAEQQGQLITAGTNVATTVLDAWLASKPFSDETTGTKRSAKTLNGRDVTTISDQEILASMKSARKAVRSAQPQLTYSQADKIVRDVYAKKFGERVRKLRYHPEA